MHIEATADAIIQKGTVCRIGLVDNGLAYMVPLVYGYDRAGTLYFHSSPRGRKMDLIRAGGRASFEIDIVDDIFARDATFPCTWSVGYECVMGEGRIEVVEERRRKERALTAIMERYAPPGEWTFPADVTARTAVLALAIESVTAKRTLKELTE